MDEEALGDILGLEPEEVNEVRMANHKPKLGSNEMPAQVQRSWSKTKLKAKGVHQTKIVLRNETVFKTEIKVC